MQHVLHGAQRWRDRESRELRRRTLWKWSIAIAFVVNAASAAGFIWARQLYASELERLQSQAALADVLERRLSTMTPAQRRQFERLLNLSQEPRHEGSR
jgi:hypothetical protein